MYGGEAWYIYGGSLQQISSLNTSIINGSTHVQIYGGSVDQIYGGNRHGTVKGEGHEYGSKIEVLGGHVKNAGAGPHSGPNGQINKKGWIRVVNAVITDHMQGGGFDCNNTTTRFPLMDGAKVEVIDSVVQGPIYGGGDDGWQPQNKPSVKGDIDISIAGSTVEGNVYGGAKLGPVMSNVSIHITDSTVAGVFGAGAGGSGVTASVNGSVAITIDGNSQIGNVYGGANSTGEVGANVDVNILDAEVANIHGAGLGSATSVVGTSKITIRDGAHVTGNIYGGGDSGSSKTSSLLIQGGTIDGSIFGGGNNIGTGSAQVTVSGTPALGGSIYGGGQQQCRNHHNIRDHGQRHFG